jgi:TIR domain-containing protein/pentapeptide repeat protein
MANQEQLDRLLKQSVQAWNNWREDNLPDYRDDMPPWREKTLQIDLRGADLNTANLSEVNLSEADLRYADLRYADLSRTYLDEADLRYAKLNEADLHEADLIKADLRYADLSRADLRGAFLNEADLSHADFRGADFREACVGWGFFGNVDLSVAYGLETIRHEGPSTIGIDTIVRSQGKIPEIFLHGAGVLPSIIEVIPSLVGSVKPIDFYSCFISYSSKDETFAKRLYADLQRNNVRCWFAPEDLKIGEEFRSRIDESIRFYDKLMVILSQHSIDSSWVEFEVKRALQKEQEQGKLVLFPLKLDETAIETPEAWAADIRKKRYIGDFTNWNENAAYQKALARLLRDLKAEPPRRL